VFAREGETVDLSAVTAVYYRRPTIFRLPDGMSEADRTVALTEARLGVGGLFHALDRVPWVNHPARIATAEYKPAQLQTAARAGLRIPATYIGNDRDAARDFARQAGGDIVCKPFIGHAISENGQTLMTWTARIDAGQIEEAPFAATAHLLQAWVPKAYEVRVTVAGNEVFPVRIDADSEAARIDWRRDYAAHRYTLIPLPDQVRQGITAYMDTLGLVFGAFDFVVTPDDEWVFLECNPAGQWAWLEEATGAAIAAAIAGALTASP
jgi:ATP-grasp ribosomal peptide maturase